MIRDGWVCRACWKPNGPNEDRCYRCKTPRDEQPNVEAGSRIVEADPGANLTGRLDTQLPVLALLAAWPLRVYGAFVVGIGIFVLFISLFAGGDSQPVMGIDGQAFLGLLGFGLICLGALQVFIARSVRRGARWAYAIAALVGLGGSLPRLLNLVTNEQLATGWARTGYLVGAWLYLGMALCAAALLVTSFIRVDDAATA